MTTLPLADFLINGVLKSFCFLLLCKVQSDLAILHRIVTLKNRNLDLILLPFLKWNLHQRRTCGRRAAVMNNPTGCKAPAPTPASLPEEETPDTWPTFSPRPLSCTLSCQKANVSWSPLNQTSGCSRSAEGCPWRRKPLQCAADSRWTDCEAEPWIAVPLRWPSTTEQRIE